MRVMALVKRILRQLVRDKRTIGLLIFAPILVLTMLYFVFNGSDYIPKIGLVDVPEILVDQIDTSGAEVKTFSNENEAKEKLAAQELDGYLKIEGMSPTIVLEGSDPSVTGATMRWLQNALPIPSHVEESNLNIHYLHGSSDMGQFDYFGPVLLGFFVFFFVFLIAGVSFLRERTTGTLERLLASPLKKWEIVAGYVIGFGLFTMIQSTIITAYAIYVLDMVMEGAFFYVLLIILMLALTALTLGILLSSFAHNELQMMQFIPIVVVPQVFFSGLFNLETIAEWLSWIGILTPLYYAAEALRDVMVRGYGWGDIYPNLLALLGFCLLFIAVNIMVLRKYRKI
ncbi:ABC transporter permease [Sporosarcina thermotolerans]|uniref:ABC transporter permease n=1 Tax=Sporosarcina thermotolerans TaxID=633404 RepID=A0AAW9A7I2_9BACL|nr:ABC transporter permease [Sporosarcina thermotolerans]MDW0116930.1 ABC transporter permease [Sporosarcina thermotolerans]